jgi:hypothetical protein
VDLADITFISDNKEGFTPRMKDNPGWFIEIHLLNIANPLMGKGGTWRVRALYKSTTPNEYGQMGDSKKELKNSHKKQIVQINQKIKVDS